MSEREDRRLENHAFAASTNRPAAPPAAAPTINPHLTNGGLGGFQFPEEPDRFAHATVEGLAAARKILGDDWVARKAADELAALPPYASQGVRRMYGEPPFFERHNAERAARSRSVLRAIVAGDDLDGDAIDLEVGVEMLRAWRSLGQDVGTLAGDALAAVARRESAMRRGDEGFPYLSVAGVCDRALKHEAVRSKLERECAAILSSMAALPGELESRVGPIVEEMGGAEKLIPMIREAAVRAKAYPGPDEKLDQLRRDFDEADTLMKEMCPPSGEEPGDLFATASARRDELHEAVRARKAVVEKAAMDRIRSGAAELLAGNPANVARLQATAKRTPEAFPDGFAERLDQAAFEAVLEAGAYGFSLAT